MIRRPPRSTLFPTRRSSDLPRDHRGGPDRGAGAAADRGAGPDLRPHDRDRKSTRLNSSHPSISYAVFCLKKKKKKNTLTHTIPATTLSIISTSCPLAFRPYT